MSGIVLSGSGYPAAAEQKTRNIETYENDYCSGGAAAACPAAFVCVDWGVLWGEEALCGVLQGREVQGVLWGQVRVLLCREGRGLLQVLTLLSSELPPDCHEDA